MYSDELSFTTMETSYPNPFKSQSQWVDKRNEYMIPPFERTYNQENYIKNRVIEDIEGPEDNRRNYVNDNHNIPFDRTTGHSAPFSHLMKRNSNIDKIGEILGSKQNTSKFNNVDFSTQTKPTYQQAYLDNVYTDTASNNITHREQMIGRSDKTGTIVENKSECTDEACPYDPNSKKPKMKVLDSSLLDVNSPRRPDYPLIRMNDNDKKYEVYKAINEYFKDFVLTKTSIHGDFSVYKSIVQCLLCTGVRYIVAIVKDDSSPLKTRKLLHTLNWVSFQTRFSEDDKELVKFKVGTYTQIRPENTILDDIIRLNRKTNNSNIYYCDNLPLQVEILREEDDDIAEIGKVTSALELYSTILTFMD